MNRQPKDVECFFLFNTHKVCQRATEENPSQNHLLVNKKNTLCIRKLFNKFKGYLKQIYVIINNILNNM